MIELQRDVEAPRAGMFRRGEQGFLSDAVQGLLGLSRQIGFARHVKPHMDAVTGLDRGPPPRQRGAALGFQELENSGARCHG